MKNLEPNKLGKKCRGYKTDYYDDYEDQEAATEKCIECTRECPDGYKECNADWQQKHFPEEPEKLKINRRKKKPKPKSDDNTKKKSKTGVNIYDLLMATGYNYVPYKFIEKLGPEAAVYLTKLIYSYDYFRGKGDIKDGEPIFSTHTYMEKKTKMSKSIQQACEEKIVKHGLIEIEYDNKKGRIEKKFFLLNWGAIEEFIKD